MPHIVNPEIHYDLWVHPAVSEQPLYIARVTDGPRALVGRAFVDHSRYLVSERIRLAARELGHPNARTKANDIIA